MACHLVRSCRLTAPTVAIEQRAYAVSRRVPSSVGDTPSMIQCACNRSRMGIDECRRRSPQHWPLLGRMVARPADTSGTSRDTPECRPLSSHPNAVIWVVRVVTNQIRQERYFPNLGCATASANSRTKAYGPRLAHCHARDSSTLHITHHRIDMAALRARACEVLALSALTVWRSGTQSRARARSP